MGTRRLRLELRPRDRALKSKNIFYNQRKLWTLDPNRIIRNKALSIISSHSHRSNPRGHW